VNPRNGSESHPSTLLWAKTGNKLGIFDAPQNPSWHSLQCHMVDVATVFLELWFTVLPMASRNWLAEAMRLPEAYASRWLGFLAGIHDMGKATPGFQGKWDRARTILHDAGLDFPVTANTIPHGVAAVPVLRDLLEERGFGPECSLSLATCTAGHHGVFATPDKWIDLGVLHLGGARWDAARRDLFWRLSNLLGVTELPLPHEGLSDNAFLLMVAGLASVSDWIASSQDLFPYQGSVDLTSYLQISQERAKTALGQIGWVRLERTKTTFDKVFPFPPNHVQKAAMEVADSIMEPSLVLIEAPMGQGKTEASLWLQDEMSIVLGLGGSYIALPTEATSNQMFGRVRNFLERRYIETKTNLHLVHGHASLSEEYRTLKPSSISDESGVGSVVAEEWFLPKKRALLSTFAVGTIDQALLSVLRVKHSFVRLFGLSGKVVIIDEVHAYDTYTSTLLDRLLSWLSAMQTSVILLSATLPRARRAELLKAYSPEQSEPEEGPYPRITWVSKTSAGSVSFPDERKVKIGLKRIGNDVYTVAGRLGEAVRSGGCAVWMCNTVARAQQAYLALQETLERVGCRLMLFHARFPYEEREIREHEVLRAFGKNGCRPHSAILVATQVVEQSLDLDFDLMVTDIAPVDLLLQRCGRLHRHNGTTRPASMSAPFLWLVEPDCSAGVVDFGGSKRVYEEYTLLRSWVAIRDRDSLSLPEDIDYLIQMVYDNDELCGLDIDPHLVEQIAKCKTLMERRREDQLREGKFRLIQDPSYPDSILEAFSVDLQDGDPTVHKAFQALTRQGVSVEVVCLHLSDSGLGLKEDGSELVDLEREPDFALTGRLLKRSIRIGHRSLVFSLLKREVPSGWRQSAHLRHHRYLQFRKGVDQVDGWTVMLDQDLGLVIERG